MFLRYFNMTCERSIHHKSYFADHVYFIGYYLYLRSKKLKFETDGTYNMILIEVGGVSSPKVELSELFKVIRVYIPFDFERYINGTQQERYSYYLELFKEGLTVAANFRPIPLDELKEYLQQLKADNFICRWDFKNVSIKELGLKVKFTGQLTSFDFKLIADAYRKREQFPFCSGTVIRTKPNSILFGFISRNIIVKDGSIRICGKSNSEFFYIPLENLCEGKFTIEKSMPRSLDNPNSSDTFFSMQRSFQYTGDELKMNTIRPTN